VDAQFSFSNSLRLNFVVPFRCIARSGSVLNSMAIVLFSFLEITMSMLSMVEVEKVTLMLSNGETSSTLFRDVEIPWSTAGRVIPFQHRERCEPAR